MGLYLLDKEPPLDPPEPDVVFICEGCGNEICEGEEYYRVDGKPYCEGCVPSKVAEKDYDDGPDPDEVYDRWRERYFSRVRFLREMLPL